MSTCCKLVGSLWVVSIQNEGVITASERRPQFYQTLVSGSLKKRDNVPERRRTSCDKCDALDP